jgi:hypothetical protein
MDVSEFEDEPMGYLRREIEGTDADSRRKAATEFVRGLMEHFEAPVTTTCGKYIEVSLANYEKDKRANWKEKDTALYLIMALGAKSVNERVSCKKAVRRFVATDVCPRKSRLARLRSTRTSLSFKSSLAPFSPISKPLPMILPLILSSKSMPSNMLPCSEANWTSHNSSHSYQTSLRTWKARTWSSTAMRPMLLKSSLA